MTSWPSLRTDLRNAGADYLLAVKANQPGLREEIETFFKEANPAGLDRTSEILAEKEEDAGGFRRRSGVENCDNFITPDADFPVSIPTCESLTIGIE